MFGIYYTVHSFMRDELGLTGVSLQVFAFIYSFAHDGMERYRASREYIAIRIGACDRSVTRALKELIDKGFITRRKERSAVGYSYGIPHKLADAHLDPYRFQSRADDKLARG